MTATQDKAVAVHNQIFMYAVNASDGFRQKLYVAGHKYDPRVFAFIDEAVMTGKTVEEIYNETITLINGF